MTDCCQCLRRQVFEACVSQHQEALLQDWVLFSLPNFATARPAGRSTWLLACFLAGASRRPWLRAAFPLLQVRFDAGQWGD